MKGNTITYDEIKNTYGIRRERVELWLSKGFVQGRPDAVRMDSLETFLADIGYTEVVSMAAVKGRLAAAYNMFVNAWPELLSPELNLMLHEYAEGENLSVVASRHHISVSTLQYYLRLASIRLNRYFNDIPSLRRRLAELTMENRRLAAVLRGRGVPGGREANPVKDKILSAIREQMGGDRTDHERAYDEFMRILHTPVTEMGLSVRCSNAAVKGGLHTLFDFLVVNKACGKSGMLSKLPHFGMKCYSELEAYLKRLNLIRTDKSGNWQSVADVLIDTNSELYLRYSGAHATSYQRWRLKNSELVAEWIGNYLSFTHTKKREKIG